MQQEERSLDYLMTAIEDTSSSTKFNESWPSTDRGSSILVSPILPKPDLQQPSEDEESREDFLNRFLERNRSNNKENTGTLSSLVRRFRENPPKSRATRKKEGEESVQEEFWWMQKNKDGPNSYTSSSMDRNSSSGNMPSSINTNTSRRSPLQSLQNQSNSHGLSRGGDSSDNLTARIQQRAARLLELSNSSLSNSTDFTQGILSDEAVYKCQTKSSSTSVQSHNHVQVTKTLHTASLSDAFRSPQTVRTYSLSPQSKPKTTLRPEEDILYQWRLHRKMELAQAQVKSVFNPNANLSTPSLPVRQPLKELTSSLHSRNDNSNQNFKDGNFSNSTSQMNEINSNNHTGTKQQTRIYAKQYQGDHEKIEGNDVRTFTASGNNVYHDTDQSHNLTDRETAITKGPKQQQWVDENPVSVSTTHSNLYLKDSCHNTLACSPKDSSTQVVGITHGPLPLISDSRNKRDDEHQASIKAVVSSSANPPCVLSAVSEVLSERLFEDMQSSLPCHNTCSKQNQNTPLVSTQAVTVDVINDLPQRTVNNQLDGIQCNSLDEDSDGEYEGDEILQNLRERRSCYRNQIEKIERMLASYDDVS